MEVSVILVNYNTCQVTRECVDSIFAHTGGVELEVIVVDNASEDASEQVLGTDPRITYIRNSHNLGFGRANNVGASVATGDHLFFLNSDTLLTNNAIALFRDYAVAHQGEFGVLGCVLLSPDGGTCHSHGRFITPARELRGLAAKYLRFLKPRGLQRPRQVTEAAEVDYVTGADLWIPRAVWERVGGFDPDFFMYCEEVDLQRRMARMGLRRLVIPGPGIIHLEGASEKTQAGSGTWGFRRLRNILESKRTYGRKHFAGPSRWLANTCRLAAYLPLIALSRRYTGAEKRQLLKTLM